MKLERRKRKVPKNCSRLKGLIDKVNNPIPIAAYFRPTHKAMGIVATKRKRHSNTGESAI